MLPQTLGTYVYLASLYDIDENFANKAKAYSTFNPSNSINGKQHAIQPIISAISTLTNIAATQEQIERQAIKLYVNKLNKHLKNPKLPDSLKHNLEQQLNKIQNSNFENYETDQLNLIQAINIITQNLNSYERRLQQISKPVQQQSQFNGRLEFNIQERLEKFLENNGKKQAKGQRAKYIQRDKDLNQLMDKEFNKTNLPSQLINEFKSLLYVDFNNWVENNSSKKISYTSLTNENIASLFKEYTKLQEDTLTETHLQRIIRTSNEQLLSLTEDMQKFLHSTFLNENEVKDLRAAVEGSKKGQKVKFRGDELTYKQAKNLLETYNYSIENNGTNFSFTLHSSVSHGNFYEFFKTIIGSAVNIEGNVAGDLILPIGTATFTESEQKQQSELMKLANGLQTILTEDFKERKQLLIEDFNEAVKKEQLLSSKMRDEITKTQDSLNDINELTEQFFIAHESTKLYRSAEQQDSKFLDFHGRNMAALQALSKLYASPELSNAMIDPKKMLTYIINISEATLAVNQRPLETYLSLFAGLLMFDDINTLAQTSIQQIESNIQSSTINCIHVYNIGGVYFPISTILKNLILQMNDIVNGMRIDYGRTAVAVITGPTPQALEYSDQNSWENLANETMKNTRIQIHFLAGYMEYVSQLLNNFN